jgi:excisionase family DNA binding protein
MFTRRELAAYLRCSTRQVDRLCESGKLRYSRLGSQKRFSFDDVMAYLDRHRPTLSSPASSI